MEFLKQPKPMNMKGNLSQNWKRFVANFDVYSLASGCNEKPEEVQAAILLYCIGEEAREIIETLQLSDEDKKKPSKIKEGLKTYFVQQTNTNVQRYKFNMRVQKPQETFDSFVRDLKLMAEDCDFETFKEQLIKDRIVCGIREDKIRERLLKVSNLTLKKATEICQTAEQTDIEILQLLDQNMEPKGQESTIKNYTSRQEENEPPTNTGNDEKDECSQGYAFVDCHNFQVPSNAVKAGIELDGSEVFIGQTSHAGDILPCKIIPARKQAYSSWNMKEVPVQNFKVLVTKKTFSWVQAELGHVQPGALPAGRTSSGEVLYCGRTFFDPTDVGKVHPSHRCLYVPFHGKELAHSKYEVLVLHQYQ